MIDLKNVFTFLFLSFLVIGITYSNHFLNTFHFDDVHVIQLNAYIKSLHNIPLFFKDAATYSAQPLNQQYRPMVTLTLAIDYWLGRGLNPFWFHVSTFLWYLVQCSCLFFLYLTFVNRSLSHTWNPYFAMLAVLWYAIHPAEAETINYICARSDALSTCFLVLALTVYVAFPKARKWGCYHILFFVACLFKQTAIVFPALLCLYLFFFEEYSLSSVFKKTVVIWLMACGLAYFLIHMDATTYRPGGTSIVAYWMTQPDVFLHYVENAILPFWLSADADWPLVIQYTDFRFIIGCAFILSLMMIGLYAYKNKKTRPIAFGLLWFFIAHLPTSCISLADPMNDHRMFLPNIGLLFAVAYGMYLLTLRYQSRAFVLCLMMIIMAYAYGAYQRNLVWKTEESLWYDVTQKSPHNGRGLMAYGVIQLQQRHFDIAEQYLLKAQKYSPTYSYVYMYLGVLYSETQQIERAAYYFEEALRYGSQMPIVLYYAATFYEGRQPELAERMLLHAAELSPGDLNIRHALIRLYQKTNQLVQLKDQRDRLRSIAPNDELLY